MMILAAFALLWFASLLAWMLVWRKVVNPKRLEERLRAASQEDLGVLGELDDLGGSGGSLRAHHARAPLAP